MAQKRPDLIGIYGAGHLGRRLGEMLGAPFVFVDDTPDKQGETIDGSPVLSLEDFRLSARGNGDYALYVGIWSAGFDFEQKRREIAAAGLDCLPFTRVIIESGSRLMFFEPLAKLREKMPQYRNLASRLADEESRRALWGHLAFRQSGDFSDLVVDENRFPDFLARELNADISYVDAGAYDGDTIAAFVDFCGGAPRRVVALEPDADNSRRLRSRFADNLGGRLFVMEAALAATRGRRRFAGGNGAGSAFCARGATEVDAVQWEDIDAPAPAHYKLDIEGEEPAVIRAAAASIARARPSLSISVYHAPDDLLEIAKTIDSLAVGYRLHLRCHEKGGGDLMLHALAQK